MHQQTGFGFPSRICKCFGLVTEREISFHSGRSKLAEVLEKILKAELIRLGWPLEKTHDLQRLRDALVARSSDLAAVVKPLCDSLAEAYMTTRYPGFDLDEPDWPALARQVNEVTTLLEAVKARIQSPPKNCKIRFVPPFVHLWNQSQQSRSLGPTPAVIGLLPLVALKKRTNRSPRARACWRSSRTWKIRRAGSGSSTLTSGSSTAWRGGRD